jgi:hypothetical protein
MVWRLELVRGDLGAACQRIHVCEVGEIWAPTNSDEVGIGLKPAQQILGEIQRAYVCLQEVSLKAKALRLRITDPSLVLQDYKERSVQTLFGVLRLKVPRLKRPNSSLPAPQLFEGNARSSSEYDAMRSKLGAFMSFRSGETMIRDFFPLAVGASERTLRRRVLRRGRLLTRKQVYSGKSEGARAIDLGIDTTFVRSSSVRGPRHHEILVGVASNSDGDCVKLGVAIGAVDRPSNVIKQSMIDLGLSDETEVTSFTDGALNLRNYLKQAGVKTPPMLDWAHLARRVQIAKTTAKDLKCKTNAEARARPLIKRTLQTLHWRLWHGNTEGAHDAIKRVERLLRPFHIDQTRARTAIPAMRLQTAVGHISTYLESQAAYLVNYGQRKRNGLPIGTATTEGLANSLVNQRMNKRQQMRWSLEGANAVVTVRLHYINSQERLKLAA